MGLCELIYTNIRSNSNIRAVKIECRNKINSWPDGILVCRSGHCSNVDALLRTLMVQMQEQPCIVSLSVDNINELMSMEARNENDHTIYVSNESKIYFGFDTNGPYADGTYSLRHKLI